MIRNIMFIKKVFGLILFMSINLIAQDKDAVNSLSKTTFNYFLNRTGIHTGNLVRTAYSNYGNLGSRNLSEARMEWPVGSGVTYGYEFIFWVASEVVTDGGDTLHIISDRYSGSPHDAPTTEDHNWGWEPKLGYFNDGLTIAGINEDLNNNNILDTGEDLNNNGILDFELINMVEYPAMSHLPQTWPSDWPEGSHPGIVGDRQNKWNGFYGAYVRADQESYYVMDDRSNDEFPYYPFPDNSEPFMSGGRRGVGLEVEVRNYQWNNPLAEDILISIYYVKNVSDIPLNKNIVGMYVDADIGQNDANDDDSDFDSVDDITYQWDIEGLDHEGRQTGYFGFAFLQSPGLIDGIDNDDDGMIDESQSNGIDDDGDWVSFTDNNGNGEWDFEDLNFNGVLDNGEDINNDGIFDNESLNDDVGSDGLAPFDPNYTGPDVDGTQGNDLPDDGEPNFEQLDNDEIDQIGLTSFFSGGTGGTYVPVDDESYWATKIQPGTFTVAASGGDIGFSYGCGFFELMPDATESFAIANLFGNDFDDILNNKRTMQTIYDADFNFLKPPNNSNLEAVAGDRKIYLSWDNLAEKSKDPLYGNDFSMYKLYRSTDPYFNSIKTITDAFGNPVLWEPIVQFDLKDGLTGAHPIPLEGLGVSYDMGTDSGLQHSYIDSLVDNGRTYYYALVAVDQGYDLDFVERGISEKPNLAPISPSESSKLIEVDVLGNILFLGKNVVSVVPREPAAGSVPPVFESNIVHTGNGTGSVMVVIANPNEVKDRSYELFFTDDSTLEHNTTKFTIIDQLTEEILLEGPPTDFESDNFDIELIDGLKFNIVNDTLIEPENINWSSNSNLNITITSGDITQPIDYEIRFFISLSDTSYHPLSSFRYPVKFQVWNVTYNEKMEFKFEDADVTNGGTFELEDHIEAGDVITLIAERTSTWNMTTSWDLKFKITAGLTPINPIAGDKILVTTSKPFSSADVFEFSTSGWGEVINKTESILDNIFVVPDPYVALNPLEGKRSAALSGRGERRIDFLNLPLECDISIYTVSGKLVTIINHKGTQDNGRESWDLTTRDGLEVSYGLYFFHVEAPGIGQKLGRFAIIK